MTFANLIASNKTTDGTTPCNGAKQGARVLSLTVPQSFVARLSVAAACLLALGASHAATPADPFNYSRASSYTYDSQGRVSTETSEPDSPDHCVLTTFGYDPYGNRSQVKTEPCLSTSTAAKFAARQSDVVYNSQTYSYKDSSNTPVSVQLPAGMSPTDSYPVGNTVPADPLGRKLNQVFDPRFGVAVTVTDSANSLSTKIGLDDLGRKISEQRPDGSISYTWYCVLADVAVSNFQSTNTVNVINASNTACAAPPAGESPTNAVMYVQTTQYTKNISGTYVPGPYSRVYSDRLGRTLRVATQSFDGASQPAGKSAASVVQDTIYNAYGVATVQTQPYFLSSKSSTLGGSNDRGLTKTVVDALGRPIEVYSTDAQGSQNVDFGAGLDASSFGTVKAARQLFSYVGLVVTTTNDKGQTRREEKNPLGELVRVTDVNGAQLVHQRDAFGNLVETKDALQNRIQISYDLRGNKIQMIDPDKGLLQYCYDALGQLKAQQNSTMRGNRTTPNACPSNTGTGTTAVSISEWTTFAYDTLGRMTQRIEPEGTSTWAYDKYADGTACSKGIGKLCEAKTSSPGMSRKVAYDSLGRTSKTLIDTGDGNKFASALDYDAQSGRLLTQTYPTGVKVGYSYTGQGALEKVYLYNKVKISPLPNANNVTAAAVTLDVGATLWQAKQVNAWGQSEQQGYGNGVTTTASYEALTGRTSSLQASATGVSVISQSYSWDSNNNLTARSDAIGDGSGAVTETFVYGDQLNRLTSYTVSGPAVKNLTRTVYLSYNALGQLLYKSDVGLYTYGVSGKDTVRPHALTHLEGFAGAMPNTDYTYDLNGNLKTASAGKYRTLSYTSFDLPDSGAGIQGPSGTPKYTWTYDENHARIKEVRVIADGTSSAGTRTTWSLHPDNMGALSFEREVNDPTKPSASNPAQASNRHYISAGGQTVAVLVSTGDLPTNGSLTAAPTPTTASIDSATSAFKLVKMEYWHKDHLGSLVATTDQPATGVNVTVTARYAYDPFGKRRYSGGNYDVNGQIKGDWNPALNAGTDRGYTGHEHLDDVGVIHMNGRLFDPTLGIFMQADPHVTDPTDLQNYNRYGYCLNNPLTCTDPSGFDGVNIDNQTRLMTLDALIERATRLLAGPDIVISPPAPAYTPSYNITIGAGSAGASSPISNSGSYPGSSLEYFVYQFDQGHLGSGTFGLNNSINVNGGIGGITSGGSLTVITNCGFECASKMFGSTPQTPSPVSSSTGGGASSGGGSVYTPTPIAPTPPTPVPTQATAPSLGATGLSIGLDVLPFVGTAKSAIQLYNGYDLITGEPINPWMEAGGLFLGMVPGGKLLTKSDRIIDAAKGVDLTAEQLKNIRRFEKKLPANAKDSLSVRPLPNDGVVVQGTSPGRVPGSSAVYEKQIDAAGNTIQSTKTTYDPAGNIVHVKDKLNGGVFP